MCRPGCATPGRWKGSTTATVTLAYRYSIPPARSSAISPAWTTSPCNRICRTSPFSRYLRSAPRRNSSAPCSSRRSRCRRKGKWRPRFEGRSGSDGQVEAEGGANAGLAVHLNIGLVQIEDAQGDGQSEPGTAARAAVISFGLIVAVEHVGQVFRGNAAARVGNLDDDPVLRWIETEA